MKHIGIDDFTPFFQALYGRDHSPFPWQTRLAERALAGNWPSVIALPTASGKTACIDIAVFALACQVHLPVGDRTAPRRIFFVVDRRVIVDEAFQRAQNLARKLLEASSGILREVADRLRGLAGGDEPLACFQLRGGIYRDDHWARTPVQPTVIASTVDQIGSRLLFRGYGLRGGSMWPVHAGLAANDSLILLDEAHCARPFSETAAAIERYRQRAEVSVTRPFVFTTMTATPAADVAPDDVLRAEADDRSHPVLGPRLKVSKPVMLVVAEKAKGARALPELADELARRARALAQPPDAMAIGIIVNRVATAKLVYEQLRLEPDSDAVLLIGRMRSIDRDRVVTEWLRQLSADASGRRKLPQPVFVVATQCLEVGANLDFDALVSECASLDALRQRFGRLNRMGRQIMARGVIVIRADQVKPKEEDPIYGEALSKTWQWLGENSSSEATVALGRARTKADAAPLRQIDFGIARLDELLKPTAEASKLLELQAPSVSAPVMLPAHVDCWAQTAPSPRPTPDEALFLHGPERGAPEVQVLWRADLDQNPTNAAAWVEALSLCPPASGEYLPVPLHIFRKWLKGQSAADELSDVVGGRAGEEMALETDETGRTVLRWGGPDDSALVTDPSDLRPGDTYVVPASLGGWDVFGHIPDTERDIDLGDRAHRLARGQTVLRLHPALTQAWPPCAAKVSLLQIADGDIPEDFAELRQLLSELGDDTVSLEWGWLATAARDLARDRRLKVLKHPTGGLALLGAPRRSGAAAQDAFTGEDDSSLVCEPATLEEHCQDVSSYAEAYAQGCGLGANLVADISLAGRLHDMGKADPRFQLMLHGGNRWKAAAAAALMAKSERMPQSIEEGRRLREMSGYPNGARHELLSVRLIESSMPDLLATAHDPELVLHLIECHHGHCRPFAPVVADAAPPETSLTLYGANMRASASTGLERLDSGVAERFWRLTRRYGWWGLAYLESMLRLADHTASAVARGNKEAMG